MCRLLVAAVLVTVLLSANVGLSQGNSQRSNVPTPPEPGLTGLQPLEMDDADVRDQKHEKFTELRDRIEQLGELLRLHRSASSKGTIENLPAAVGEGFPEALPNPREDQTPDETGGSREEAFGEQKNSPLQGSRVEGEAKRDGSVDGAIDRVALASSLFASGEYETCVQTIQSIDFAAHRTEIRRWLTYLHAGCLRKLGSDDESKRFYRKIVTEDPEDWLGNQSRWWIDQMSEKSELERNLHALTQSLDQWRIEVDGLLKSN
ncbi:hypothetical protein AB1L42_19760 [Thalassoglobus sp. JC818]|uniref:hypothetical protein n=1 Tax=Thalassoglobus sp. JC818 TaxID=3232136 RepID=UPI003458A7EF